MNDIELIKKLNDKSVTDIFTKLYAADMRDAQKERYTKAIACFGEVFNYSDSLSLFSAPGRTELGGNHTDHNLGCVLAASVNLDVIAVVAMRDDNVIRIKSEGYNMDVVNLTELKPVAAEENTSAALIRGVCARINALGFNIGGFDAYTTSDVLKGSGLSSSAAFEVLVGTILNSLYNDDKIDSVTLAKIAQYAENFYFKKPCGLMDQMASSVGGVICIDFGNKNDPVINRLHFDFDKTGYQLYVVDTGGNHADLTDEYAAIPFEMKSVATFFGKEYLSQLSKADILKNLPELREKFGDRAVLRSLHFVDETKRSVDQFTALTHDNFERYLALVNESGLSSYQYLQNIFCAGNVTGQPLAIGLYLARNCMSGGASRVHGGGFGGTIQCYVRFDDEPIFIETMEKVFGKDACHKIRIRPYGGIKIV